MVKLSESSCVVFGAGGGLGRPIAERLFAEGAHVTMVGRDVSRLEEVKAEGPRLSLDIRQPEAAENALRLTTETFGGVDVIVNAIGVVAFGSVEDLAVDVLEELFLTNTFAPVFIAKAALGRMRPNGMIVNIPGVIAEKNLPNMVAYGASKAALKSWDEGFRREARRSNIQVLDARPGHTETGLASRSISGAAPKFPEGLDPAHVASVIVEGIKADKSELGSTQF